MASLQIEVGTECEFLKLMIFAFQVLPPRALFFILKEILFREWSVEDVINKATVFVRNVGKINKMNCWELDCLKLKMDKLLNYDFFPTI